MAYKKQEWFELKRSGLMFELVVRDQDFKRLETKKFTPQNFDETIKDIGNRYGIGEEMRKPNREVQEEIEHMRKNNLF